MPTALAVTAAPGRRFPAPRPTAWACVALALRYGVPIVVAGFALDLFLVWLARR